MFELNSLGKVLMLFGVIIFLVGGLFIVGDKIPWLGKLPGDVCIKRNNFTFFFPITTCIIISLTLSLLLILLRKR